MRDLRKYGNDSRLPTRLRSPSSSACYSWDDSADKELLELDIDFRPPSIKESWNWVLDSDEYDSDAQSSSGGEDLNSCRYALLLEYLPNAHRFQSHILTPELATDALDGLQQIQKALVERGDHSEMISRNILVGEDRRVVFIDFDRAKVFRSVDSEVLRHFKKCMLEFHLIVFDWMVRVLSTHELHIADGFIAYSQERGETVKIRLILKKEMW